MFSGATSFAERLRAAAQAGVEQFDQARIHAPDLHLPKINLTGPASPGQGTSSPVQSPLSPGAESVKRLVGIASPRRSGEIERTSSAGSGHSALSSRLNSLVAGAAKGRAQVKSVTSATPSTQTTGLSAPASITEGSGSTVPQPQAANATREPVGMSDFSLLPPLAYIPCHRPRQHTASTLTRSRSLHIDRNKHTRLKSGRHRNSHADSGIRLVPIQHATESITLIPFERTGNSPPKDPVAVAKSRCRADHRRGRRRTGSRHPFGCPGGSCCP